MIAMSKTPPKETSFGGLFIFRFNLDGNFKRVYDINVGKSTKEGG